MSAKYSYINQSFKQPAIFIYLGWLQRSQVHKENSEASPWQPSLEPLEGSRGIPWLEDV